MNVSGTITQQVKPRHWSSISWIIVAFLAAMPFLLVWIRSEGSINLHTNMEIVSMLLALVVGLTALARYWASPDLFTLMLGAGFLGAAFLDGYHMLVTSAAISPYLPSSLPSLVPWSWVASRFFLGLLVFASCVLASRRLVGRVEKKHEVSVFLTTGTLTLLSFLFFAFAPLPRAYYPELWVHRPEEFVPGAFFLFAAVIAVRHQYWRGSSLKRWLCVFLAFSLITQFLVMPFSLQVFDGPFDVAHLMKVSSYGAVFAGLLTNIYEVFLERGDAERTLQEKARMLQMKSEEADQARLEAENALKAKSEFLAVMSHEIRTPLNGVLGMSDLLQQSELSKSQREILQYIRESGDALNTIINDILDFSKLEAGKIRLEKIGVSLQKLAASCVGLMQGRAEEKSLSIVLEMDEALPGAVLVDPTRLRQILLNLISNAIKFTDGGAIVVRLQHGGEHAGGHRVIFSVTDTGIGMTEAQLKTLFAKFEQADASVSRKFGGSGLGLSIVKQLVNLMGADIGVESAPGRGSTFYFELLLTEAEELHTSQVVESDQAFVAVRALDILIVDDNLVNRAVLSMMLEKLGHRAHQFDNAQDFLDQIDSLRPDLTLLDIRMPKIDGLTAIWTLRAREQGENRHKVVACSADVISDFRDDDSLKNKFDGFLSKPVRLVELVAIIDRVIGAPCHNQMYGYAEAEAEQVPEKERRAQLLQDTGQKNSAQQNSGQQALDDLLKELT